MDNPFKANPLIRMENRQRAIKLRKVTSETQFLESEWGQTFFYTDYDKWVQPVVSFLFGSYLLNAVGMKMGVLEKLILACPVVLGSKLESAIKCIVICLVFWALMICLSIII